MRPSLRIGSVSIAPTAFGVSATAVAVAVMVARSSIIDPSLAAIVWTAFAALLVLGLLAPLLLMGRVRVSLEATPDDTTVGRESPVRLRVRGPALLDSIALRIAGTAEWWSCPLNAESTLLVVPAERGVHRALAFLAMTEGPLGVVRVTRRVVVDLPRPVAVGPVPIPQRWSPPLAPDSGADERSGAAVGTGDQVRSVRPYRSGDPAHLVHWPSSARVGSLVVREFEPPVRPGVVIVVDLTSPSPNSERSIAEAAGLALAVMQSGGSVVLCTCEDGRPVVAEVGDARRLNRRLAFAGPGIPGRPPVDATDRSWPVTVVGS